MNNVTVLGAGGSIVTIAINSAAGAQVAQRLLGAVGSSIAAGGPTTLGFSDTVPSGSGDDVLLTPGQPLTVPAGASVTTYLSNAMTPVSITTMTTQALTIVSGEGGLTLNQMDAAPGTVIVAGGGANAITLASGATTVNLGVTPSATVGGVAVGTSTVSALAGGAVIDVNSSVNTTATADTALILAAGGDTVNVAGDGAGIAAAAIGLDDATVTVNLGNQGAAFLAGASIDVLAAAGEETVGVLSGATELVTGAVTGGGAIYVAAGTQLTGQLFIDPRSQNVTVFGGAGATTLFATGDGFSSNSGRDFIDGGTGYFHLGTAGGSIARTAANLTVAETTTLIGGGAGDALYAQSGNVSLLGAYGTTLLWAGGGVSVNGFSVTGAQSGVTINAGGAVGASITGASSGANTIISGTGSAVAYGNHGALGGNLYLDGAAGGSLTILDFDALDTFRLTSAQHVGGVSNNLVTLTDGTRITIGDGFINSSNVSQFFHS